MCVCVSEAPDSRCLGWNSTLQAVECGKGYEQGSYLCGTCASGWFPSMGSSQCEVCPADESNLYEQVGLVVAGLAGLGVVTYGLVVYAMRHRGGTLSGGFFRARDFVGECVCGVWCW